MITSPLRYPGGKAKLYPYFVELMKLNKLIGATYCEPYAGGAGLAIKLLINGFVNRIEINDIDFCVYAFWRSVLFDADNFCALIKKTPVTIREWHRQKKIWERANHRERLAVGFATYFLNRTNRSGIIDGAGPIGGYAQAGEWKLDVRLPKDKQIQNIKALSAYSSQITISNLDALDFFKKVAKLDDAFIYLDPPYFHKSQKLYKNFYTPDDHERIARLLTWRRKIKWIVSYDDVPEIRKCYSEFSPITYSLNYSAGEKGMGVEVIFLSDALNAPNVSGFRIAA